MFHSCKEVAKFQGSKMTKTWKQKEQKHFESLWPSFFITIYQKVCCEFFPVWSMIKYDFSSPVFMKHILASFAVVALLSGCFGGDKDTQGPAEGKVVDNPQVLFDDLTAQNKAAWAKEIDDFFPDVKAYEKTKTNFDADIKLQIEELQGDLEMNIEAENETDMSSPEDPQMKSSFDIEGKLTGEAYSGEGKASFEMLITNAMVFARLKNISAEIPNIPTSEILAPVKPLLEKWYGDSFNTINEAIGDEFSVQDMFIQNAAGVEKIRAEIIDMFSGYKAFTMKEGLSTENGMYRFAVELDKEATKEQLIRIAKLQQMSETAMEEYKTDITEDLANIDMEGTLSFSVENPKYFAFEGVLTDSSDIENNANIALSIMEKEKNITITSPENQEHFSFTIESTDNDVHTFSFGGGETAEENITLLSGSISEESFNVDILNSATSSVFDSDENETNKIRMKKDGDEWKGTITITEAEGGMVINISKLVFDETSVALVGTATFDEKEVGSFVINYSHEEAGSVEVEIPESYSPFGDLLENFVPAMGMGSPAFVEEGSLPPGAEMPPLPEEMTEEELNELLKDFEAQQTTIEQDSVQ